MFKLLKVGKRRADTAIIIQNLLELPMQMGKFQGSSRKIANDLVVNVAKANPEIMNGSRGVMPHKLSYAAAALSNHMSGGRLVNQGTTSLLMGLSLALSTILTEASENAILYPFTELDLFLLNEAKETLFATQTELEKDLGPAFDEMSQILNTPLK